MKKDSFEDKLIFLQKEIDNEAKCAAHYHSSWYEAYLWHMDRFMKLCNEKEILMLKGGNHYVF